MLRPDLEHGLRLSFAELRSLYRSTAITHHTQLTHELVYLDDRALRGT